MRDLTPVAEDDVVLKDALEQRKQRAWQGFAPRDEAPETLRVGLASEERALRRVEWCRACEPVAYDILEEARTALAVRFRFLDQALWRMPLVANYDVFGIASNGRCMVFDPAYVVDRFKLSPNEVVRDVAHCLFHCIFRHPFMLYSVLRRPWDVACDIAIEVMLLDLLGEAFPSNMDRRARQSLRVIRAQLDGVITAERLYWFFCNEGAAIDLRSLAPMFYHDTHGLWYGEEGGSRARDAQSSADVREGEGQGDAVLVSRSATNVLDGVSSGPVSVPLPETADEDADREDAADQGGNADAAEDASAVDGEREDAGADAGAKNTASEKRGQDASAGVKRALTDAGNEAVNALPRDELAQQWRDVGRRIQVELETHVASQGEGAGSLAVGLRALNRETCDYAQFLRRFATLHERMRVNDDEFDYIYYTYGLTRYGNMPLIEPLEYKEDRHVHDFVIAIDTSESCSGEVVQAFMRKTYNILKQHESFHSRVNVHVIQCDARIQSDVKITSLDQLELLLRDMRLVGFGGTDFRPVFDYVNLLIEKGELTDLRGMVYFTDGRGVFPRRPPCYDVAFAFLDDGYSDPEVPPWALKVLIPPESAGQVRVSSAMALHATEQARMSSATVPHTSAFHAGLVPPRPAFTEA